MILIDFSLDLILSLWIQLSRPTVNLATDPIPTLVQTEIQQTQTRFQPILNTWMLVAILVPSATTFCVFILVFKLNQNYSKTLTEIRSQKDESITQIKSLLSSEQEQIKLLHQQTHQATQQLQDIQEKIQSLSKNAHGKD